MEKQEITIQKTQAKCQRQPRPSFISKPMYIFISVVRLELLMAKHYAKLILETWESKTTPYCLCTRLHGLPSLSLKDRWRGIHKENPWKVFTHRRRSKWNSGVCSRAAFCFRCVLLRLWMAASPWRGACFANDALFSFFEALSPGEVTLQKPSFCNRMCCMAGHAGLDLMCVALEGSLPGHSVTSSAQMEPALWTNPVWK